MAPALIQEMDDIEVAAPSTNLELTPVEATLRCLLLDVADYIDKAPSHPDVDSQVQLPPALARERTTLRFTGGWVRDKLLGVPSHDIDVAINKMTGYQFGLRLKEYLEIPGNPEKYGLEGVATTDKQNAKAGAADKSKVVGGLHKIEANPEKSKHLETVTTKILGLDIDLVNLRKETYTEESRNPTMEFGTPEEDALRRDATVNAMFYNINTQEVEDFTGCGHDDMKAKILRTPLEPYQTFKDDPLRILRLIRFASRLDYEIDAKAKQAMKDPGIKDALRRKISRERVGIELEKALRGPDPLEALRLIYSLDLYDTIFSDPTIESGEAYKPETTGWQGVIYCLGNNFKNETALVGILVRDDEERFLAWQLAAMVPYNDAPQQASSEPGRKPPPPVAAQVAREGIKATNKVCDIIVASVRNQVEISGLVDNFKMQKQRPDSKAYGQDAAARDVLGMAVRRWGGSWRSQVTYAMLVEEAHFHATEVALSTSSDAIERKYTAFLKHIQQLNLLEANTFKPLMDGKALAKALNTPPGPWMKDALDVVMAYQLRNPETADAKSAIAEVEQHRQAPKNGDKEQKQNGGELTSSLIHHFLRLTIRPLFIKTKPSGVTADGRKVTTTILPPKIGMGNIDESVARPWKSDREAYALDLLRWCVAALDSKTIEGVWHLLIPPLLTLVDDWEIRYKTFGVELLHSLLESTPPSLLHKTGLGEVLNEALTPCLTYIPTLTPAPESIDLLRHTYPALFTLTRLRFPTPAQKEPKTSSLDSILRQGVLASLASLDPSTYPRLISLIYVQLSILIHELGVESVRHLKFVLPTLTATLTHPLLDVRVADWREVASAALMAMRDVVLAGWPRMREWRGEVLKGVCLAYVKTVDAQTKAVADADGDVVEELGDLEEAMQEVVGMLQAAVGSTRPGEDVGRMDWEGECRRLVEAEPKLEGLFEGAEGDEGGTGEFCEP